MRRWLIEVSIRFILRRLLSQDANNILQYFVKEAHFKNISSEDKHALVREGMERYLTDAPNYLINLVIELSVSLQKRCPQNRMENSTHTS